MSDLAHVGKLVTKRIDPSSKIENSIYVSQKSTPDDPRLLRSINELVYTLTCSKEDGCYRYTYWSADESGESRRVHQEEFRSPFINFNTKRRLDESRTRCFDSLLPYSLAISSGLVVYRDSQGPVFQYKEWSAASIDELAATLLHQTFRRFDGHPARRPLGFVVRKFAQLWDSHRGSVLGLVVPGSAETRQRVRLSAVHNLQLHLAVLRSLSAHLSRSLRHRGGPHSADCEQSGEPGLAYLVGFHAREWPDPGAFGGEAWERGVLGLLETLPRCAPLKREIAGLVAARHAACGCGFEWLLEVLQSAAEEQLGLASSSAALLPEDPPHYKKKTRQMLLRHLSNFVVAPKFGRPVVRTEEAEGAYQRRTFMDWAGMPACGPISVHSQLPSQAPALRAESSRFILRTEERPFPRLVLIDKQRQSELWLTVNWSATSDLSLWSLSETKFAVAFLELGAQPDWVIRLLDCSEAQRRKPDSRGLGSLAEVARLKHWFQKSLPLASSPPHLYYVKQLEGKVVRFDCAAGSSAEFEFRLPAALAAATHLRAASNGASCSSCRRPRARGPAESSV